MKMLHCMQREMYTIMIAQERMQRYDISNWLLRG
jgi:hypothetical protein